MLMNTLPCSIHLYYILGQHYAVFEQVGVHQHDGVHHHDGVRQNLLVMVYINAIWSLEYYTMKVPTVSVILSQWLCLNQ